MAAYPHGALDELVAETNRKLAETDRYNELQMAEFHETLAIAQFYAGRYKECLQSFELALKQRKTIPKHELVNNNRSLPRIHTLAGIACYRRGEFYAAQSHFESVQKIPHVKQNDIDLYCQCTSNLALVHLQLQKPESAKNTALDAVKAGINYARGIVDDDDDDNNSQLSGGGGVSSRVAGGKTVAAAKTVGVSKKPAAKKGVKKKTHPSISESNFCPAIVAEPIKRTVNLADHIRVALLVYLRVGSAGDALKLLKEHDKEFKHKGKFVLVLI